MGSAKFGTWWEEEETPSGTQIAIMAIPVPVTGRPGVWHGVEVWFNTKDGHVRNVLPKIVRGFRHPRTWVTDDIDRLPVEVEKQLVEALDGWVGLKKMITEWIFNSEI